jgi:hypothetical protein
MWEFLASEGSIYHKERFFGFIVGQAASTGNGQSASSAFGFGEHP